MKSPSRGAVSRLEYFAHEYANLGWPVFPLVPREKTPLTRNGFKDASTSHDQIVDWWRTHPEANIGVPTGLVFDVLDIDGAIGLASLDERLGFRYRHQGPVGLTGKGWHLLFAPTGQPNGANLIPKVDFRGKGGYIVVPPSIHPLGHQYRWDIENDRGPRTPLEPAQDWLLELVNRDDNPVRTARQLIAPEDPTKPATTLYDLIRDQRYPKDQLPRDLRMRSERPSILGVCAQKGWALRRRATYYLTRCVFGTHSDSTPSMAIYPHDDTFHCYGCGAHGDSFDLERDPPTHI